MEHIARGTFTVTMAPLAVEGEGPGSLLGRFGLDKTLAGDLEGTARGQMLSAGTGTPGSAGYVAIERVEGRLHGRRGSFVLQHAGVMERGEASLQVRVVPDSGTGELSGLSGRFEIRLAEGTHHYDFAYSLPARY